MVRILSLDGGGVRGLSELLILERIMEKVKVEQCLEKAPLPCEYFDIIGGTSTGGIIAIMLDRLCMSVEQCIVAYRRVSQKAFIPRRRLPMPCSPNGRYSADELMSVLKRVVSEQCQLKGCNVKTCNHDLKYRDERSCKTIVLAIPKGNLEASPTLFKTYFILPVMEACKIWEIARATSPATTFFRSIACGRDNIEFIDAGFGYNNPCKILLQEAYRVFPKCKREYFVVVSIGTGLKDIVAVQNSRTSILLALKAMATSSQRVATEMENEFGVGGRYYRFDVASELGKIGLAEGRKNDEISTHTHIYMNRPEQLRSVDACARALNSDKVRGTTMTSKRWRWTIFPCFCRT